MRSLVPLIAALLAGLPSAAPAQDGPVGIGFAQAEEGTWYCRDGDAAAALACAAERCLAEANGQDCVATAWCFPAGWSGLMVVWLSEFHATMPLCGAPSASGLQAAMEAYCAGNEYATSCSPYLIVDPDGNETAVEDVTWEGPAGAQ